MSSKPVLAHAVSNATPWPWPTRRHSHCPLPLASAGVDAAHLGLWQHHVAHLSLCLGVWQHGALEKICRMATPADTSVVAASTPIGAFANVPP